MARDESASPQRSNPSTRSGKGPAAPKKLLVAASGTGGHLYPALAVAEALEAHSYQVAWLGVNNRLETQLLPDKYPLHTVPMEGFQTRLGLKTGVVLTNLARSICQTRRLLQQGQFAGVLTTGGYIAAPAILAARSLGLPSVLHESNGLPGKVTRWLSTWCDVVALGFTAAVQYLPKANTTVVGTPVRANFLAPTPLDLEIPEHAMVIVVAGGSQGAVAVNELVRACAPAWLEAGAWIVHLTGERDRNVDRFAHPHYIARPFYQNMAGLLQRANLAISRSGAGTLTELGITGTPAILIPYPFAAEDHQTVNANIFKDAGAALVFSQDGLTSEHLTPAVLALLHNPEQLTQMSHYARDLAIADSTDRCAQLICEIMEPT